MDTVIKLFVDPDSGCILDEVMVCGVLPSALSRPYEPIPEPGEINIDIYGDDTAVTQFSIFLAHKIHKGMKIFWKVADNSDAKE